MAQRGLEQRVENLEHRVETVEQILPTLATKADLAIAIEPLATKADVKAEVKAEAEITRRHFDVVAEGLRADIRVFADKIDAVEARVDARHADAMRVLTQHDRRLTRLETSGNRDEA